MNSLTACILVALAALTHGKPEALSCTFEDSVCLWQNLDNNEWMWSTGNSIGPSDKPSQDMTLSNGDGHYLYGTLASNTSSPTLLSPEVTKTGEYCFKFGVYSSDAMDAAVRVTVLENDQSVNDIQIVSDLQDGQWRTANVQFKSDNPFQLKLEGVLLNNAAGAVVAVDEIHLIEGHC